MDTVSSIADERTVNNNSSAVRHNYRVLTDEEKLAMTAIKDAGEHLLGLIDELQTRRPAAGRSCALARTKTEEAIMWAVKGLTA